ncbi:MAG: MarR family transcriptional regulator [Desulfobacteraceae bacterium]|jgi:DNA-binding MarR family transcriptional regulator
MKSTSCEDITEKIVILIRRYVRLRALYTKELAKNYGLSVPQLLCLQCLYENGNMSMSEIAENIMVNMSTVTGIVDRLEQKGFLKRLRVSTDRRVITIALTEKGKSLAENSPPAVHHKIIQAVKKLSEPEREEIFQALNRLSGLIDVDDGDKDAALPPVIEQAKNAVGHLRGTSYD